MKLLIERLDRELDLPAYNHAGDAAIDLRSRVSETLAPMEKRVIPTGIRAAVPAGHVGLIWDRSGIAAKHSVHTLAGVIDSGYRGEISVVMINLGKQDFTIERNMRICQMLVQPVLIPEVEEVKSLDATARGEKGFGSSGTE